MPFISFDVKGRHFPWRRVSWKKYREIAKRYFPSRRRKKPVPTPTPTPPPKPIKIHMFDDVNVSLIPKDAKAVAGYADGHYRTWAQVEKDFPKAKKVKIAVFGQDNGDALDVEPGDAAVSQAAAWVKRQNAQWASRKVDVSLPVIYTSASWAASLVATLKKARLTQGKHYLLWTAHYDPAKGEHLCNSSCGFGIKFVADATQYTDKALGKSLDESVTRAGFFR